MKYDETRVYTAKDADKLKAGSKVIVADNMRDLRENVEADRVTKLLRILSDDEPYRFVTRYAEGETHWMFAYLVEEPKKNEEIQRDIDQMETVMTDEEIEQEAKLWIRHNHELLDYSDFHDDVEFDHAQVADLAELYRVGYRACEKKGPVIKDNADKNIEPILCRLKDLGVIKSWYYNGTYHAQ